MRWVGAGAVVVGALLVTWALRKNTSADLSELPVLIIAGLVGVAAIISGLLTLLFASP